MSILRVFLALAVACLCAPAWAAPLEAYTRLPAIHAATLSPSGRQVALLVNDDGQTTMAVQDAATKAILARVNFGKTPVPSVRWVGERGLLVVTVVDHDPVNVSGGLMSWRRAHFFDIAASKLTPLHSNAAGGMNNIVGAPMIRTIDGQPSVFLEGIEFVENRAFVALFQADLDTGRTQPVARAEEGSRRWLVDSAGAAVAKEIFLAGSRPATIEVKTVSGWRTAYAAAPTERARLVALSADGRGVVYAVRRPNGIDEWREARLDGAPDAPPVPAADSQTALSDPQTGRLLGHYVLDGDTERYSYLDREYERIIADVTSSFAAITVEVKSWSADRKTVIAWVDQPRQSPAYALVDVVTRKHSWIASMYPGLAGADVGLKTRVRFKAADGLDLAGYLTRPPGLDQAKNLPLIVLAHNGPASRDTADFDWQAQAMASRGYAVLQLNYRGSDGLGDALREAGRGEWGRKMQTDLSDGVRALASGGLIDPKRVCIVGEGYGGYAALAGATIDRGAYRCAVSIGGIADLGKELVHARLNVGGPRVGYLKYYLGDIAGNAGQLAQVSPAQQAAQADIPILLVHGQSDRAIPLEQSQIMAAALRKAGKPADLVVLQGEGGWQSRNDARVQVTTATMAFVEKHNPPN